MKRSFALALVLIVVGTWSVIPRSTGAQTVTDWPTFHGNGQRNGYTTAPGPTTGTVSYSVTLPGEVESSPAVGPNGVAYVGDDDTNVYALDPTPSSNNPSGSGATWKWAFKTGGKVVSSPTLSIDGTTLFVGSDDGNVYALDTATGKPAWPNPVNLGAAVRASPLLSLDGSAIYVTTINGELQALSTKDGHTVWGPDNVGQSEAIPGSPSLSPDGSTLYVAMYLPYMYAIPVSGNQAGKTISTAYYLDSGATSTPAVDINGNIYVATTRGNLTKFNAGTSNPAWTNPFTTASHAAILATPAIAPNNEIIVGTGDGNLYAIDAMSGQQQWSRQIGAPINSSAAIAGNNIIYVGADTGKLYAFGMDGTLLWSTPLSAAISSSPAVGPDGSVWVADQAGDVARIGAPVLVPTNTPTNTPIVTPTATRTSTLTPTRTPIPQPTATFTATAVPSPTATPTATLVPAPPFRLRSVRVQTSSRANWSTSQQRSARVRVRQRTVLAIYVDVDALPATTRLSFTWLVRRGKTRVAHHGRHIDLGAGPARRYWIHWNHTFSSPGTYTVTMSASSRAFRFSRHVTLHVVR